MASLPLTMGISVFFIYWAFPIVAALMVAIAAWRIVFARGSTYWPAAVITLAVVCWLIDTAGNVMGGSMLVRVASAFGAISVIVCGIAAWRIQETFYDGELIPSVYALAFAAIGLLVVVTSNLVITLPISVAKILHYVLFGLSVSGCALIGLAICRMVGVIGEEYWIVGAAMLPIAMFAAVLLGNRLAPAIMMGHASGAMFLIFPFLALLGAAGFWRLAALLRDRSLLRRINDLNAGRFAA